MTNTVEVRQVKVGTRFLTYQREYVTCGKAGCSRLHGPYWYAYWQRDGESKSRYIGVVFRVLTFEQVRATERSKKRKAAAARRRAQQEVRP